MWKKWGITECVRGGGDDILEQCFSKCGLWNTIISLIWELVDMQFIRPHLRPIKLKNAWVWGCGLPSPPGDFVTS